MDEAEDSTMAERLRTDALEAALPRPTPTFRRRAWLAFQRALDPLARPRPLRLPRRWLP